MSNDKTAERRNKERAIDRLHKCEKCHEVYYCDACSQAATEDSQRRWEKSQGTLYAGAGAVHAFICEDCQQAA